MTRREYSWLNISQYVALTVVGTSVLVNMYQQGKPWWIAAGLLLALGIQYEFWPHPPAHWYLALETALTAGVMILDPTGALLGFTLTSHAMILFPERSGALWVGAAVLTTGLSLVYHVGWLNGMLTLLPLAVGLISFGLFNYMRVRSEAALREREELLAALQAAHRQLQAYADQVETLAVAQERNRLAREMHDTLGHRLTVAAVQLEGAQRLIPDDPDRAAHMVGTVHDQVREALRELRHTVATMRTPPPFDRALTHALTHLTQNYQAATGLKVHLNLPQDSPPLPIAQRMALYRVAQEALTNVQRHAQAQTVSMQLACQDGAITLQVIDDGIGITDDAPNTGLGLRGMRERAAQLNGTLHLAPRPTGGTQLTLHLPLPTEETDDHADD